MILSLINNNYEYEMQKLCMLFLPYDKITIGEAQKGEDAAVVKREEVAEGISLSATLCLNGKEYVGSETISADTPDLDKECERRLAVLLCHRQTPPLGNTHGCSPR